MAERTRRSATPPRTQAIPDHPFIAHLPRSSTSAVLSAPPVVSTTTASQQANAQDDDDDDLSLPNATRNTSNTRQSPPSTTTANLSAPPPQLLGRRQRAADSDEEKDPHAGDSGSHATHFSSDSRGPKRRRKGSMSAEGDGEASSNGTSRGHTGDSSAPKPALPGAPTNGAHKAPTSSLNGSSHQNGKQRQQQSRDPVPTTPYFGHDREEVTRILIQALSDMGYHAAAQSVSDHSGYELESPTVAAFRAAVIEGLWEEAEHFLFGAAPSRTPADAQKRAGNGSGGSVGSGLVLVEGADADAMRFCIRQQKYLELLERRDQRQALSTLRTELTPLNQDAQKLHFLSSLLMCQTADEVKSKADWDGAKGESRHHLLSGLSSKCGHDPRVGAAC